eukprot:10954851-Alexandrium_andersonii.AAC.1
MPMAVVSSLCPAHGEVLTASEAGARNHGTGPSACSIDVLNETAAKLVSEAARSGLLASFQHPECGIAVRPLGPEEQGKYIGQ